MSRWWDDVAMVVELACETSWRSDREQRALLRVAHKVDRERSKQTVTNPVWVAPYLEAHADQTHSLDTDQTRVVTPSEVKAKKKRTAA